MRLLNINLIDVTDLDVIQGREGVFVIPDDSPQNLLDE